MKFHKNSRRPVTEYEKAIAKYWKEHKTFEQSVAQRPQDKSYVFYDGPPFITGVPHVGTLLSSIIKDAVPRYWTMKGYRVERVWGWDCHGLPAEVFTEKKLGIQDRRDIGTKISLETYINTCRDNMVQTGNEWETIIERIGRWVNFSGAYKTMDADYMESVWWAFKQLYEAGKVYEGEKVLLYCTRDATPISKAEVAMDNSYKDVTDPSVFVKFKLAKGDAYLLAWTTTPWTLPANSAIAVNKDIDYVEAIVKDEHLILAKDLVDTVLTDDKHNVIPHTIERTFKGKELIGRSYEPLFENRGKNAHRVWDAEYVNLDEGTGIVHLAPAYGEEDYALAKAQDIPIVTVIDDSGFYLEGKWKGLNVWDANKPIAKELLEQGIVWKVSYITHSYPHCHRCGTRLMYRAHPSWFLDVDSQRQMMLEQGGEINWFPAHIKKGRFAQTILSAPDWNLSRDRFWATAMPVWKGTGKDGKEHVRVVGSYAELKELTGKTLQDYHRPWVDELTFKIEGVEYRRIDKVLDCWFESGSMPFAQFHYPFENQEKFEQNFPGDFIAEYVGQVRAWFYYLHTVSVGLFGQPAFRNVIVTGTLAGNDGRKMSKSYGNFTDPNELMDVYGADALRFLLLSSPVLNGEDFSLQDRDVADVFRKLGMIWNMYDFFSLYADVDNWESPDSYEDPTPQLTNPFDQWIVSRLHQLITENTSQMDKYDLPNALKPVLPFVDDASNWYIRRCRKRFWKSQNDADKDQAYQTLHYILVQLAILLAPFTPFLAEELYRKLTTGESVHLLDWPAGGHVNQLIVDEMMITREIITKALALRAQAGMKVRQPLNKLSVTTNYQFQAESGLNPVEIIQDEVNVKSVKIIHDKDQAELNLELDTHLTPSLKEEGLAREIIRYVQSSRKQAGLKVDDRINLQISSTNQMITVAIKKFEDAIKLETLAKTLNENHKPSYEQVVMVDSEPTTIALAKVS